MKKFAAVSWLSALLASSAAAQTQFVNGSCGDDSWTGTSAVCAAPDGPKRTIQAAIPTSGGSAHIIVAPGIYDEAVLVDRTDIGHPPWTLLIESESGASVTTIDAQGIGSGVRARNLGNAGQMTIRGFTIRNATSAVSHVAGIQLELRECVFTLCQTGLAIADRAQIWDCVFHENAGHGAHLLPGSLAVATFHRCTFDNNAGSAVYAQRAPATVVNCLVAWNGSVTQPAIMGLEGGGITLKTVTIAGNPGEAVYVAGRSGNPARLTAYNSILWDNNSGGSQITAIQGTNPPPIVNIEYSNVQGGYAGVGNLSSDPLFVDAGAGNFHLTDGSPAIDSGYAFLVPGDENSDLDGQPRFADNPSGANSGAPYPTYLDRGAYEAAGRPYCVGDMDDDHDVDLPDIATMLSQFGTSGTALQGDQNRDGSVSIEDLALLLSNFGVACP